VTVNAHFPVYLAPCGIYCKCCSSLGKTCLGCRSTEPQKRTSKYACYMRSCTLEKGIGSCADCESVPCRVYKKRFVSQHPNDVRYQYLRDALHDLQLLKEEGIEAWEKHQRTKWACPECGAVIWMYAYECSGCHKKWFPA
jgi:hypothetical protein